MHGKIKVSHQLHLALYWMTMRVELGTEHDYRSPYD